MNTSIEVLQACTVHGTNVKLPTVQLDRKVYQEVAKSLELIGGKWKGGKVSAFEFKTDPTELLAQIAGGEKRNLKKEFQFFGTPQKLAEEMVFYADIKNHHSVLEPSAGQGAIVKEISKTSVVKIDYCELMDTNRMILEQIPSLNINFVGEDFLELSKSDQYDRIVANPPFSKNQDIDHIQKMYQHLKRGGRMVTLCSPHYKLYTNKKERAFAEWLDAISASVKDIPAGTFKESGTNIATVLIIIDKPL